MCLFIITFFMGVIKHRRLCSLNNDLAFVPVKMNFSLLSVVCGMNLALFRKGDDITNVGIVFYLSSST